MFQMLSLDLLRSMETLASRAALVFGFAPKHWVSPGGLSDLCGLSIWSEVGSSLIPLSLGDGDQRGESDTESFPLRRALRKSSSACWGGCSVCWEKTLSAVISLSLYGDIAFRHQTIYLRPIEVVKEESHSWKEATNYSKLVSAILKIPQIHVHSGPGSATSDGCRCVLFQRDGECHRFDQTASRAARHRRSP